MTSTFTITPHTFTAAPSAAQAGGTPSDTVAGNSVQQHIASVAALSEELLFNLDNALQRIADINLTTHVLSMNARVEAARVGDAGRGFAVVAQEMKRLSDEVGEVASTIRQRSRHTGGKMRTVVGSYVSQVRDGRLCDLALVNIDLIDRNLYERSCDVRWWATDGAAVDCLANPQPGTVQHASARLGQILDSYTVYFDLVLADAQGRVLAAGRPQKHRHSVGSEVGGCSWFQQAAATADGSEFSFESVHASPLVNDQRVLVYGCAVREGGNPRGRVLGVLGVLFNWDALAQTVMRRTPLTDAEWTESRICVVDGAGRILADTQDAIGQTLAFDGMADLLAKKRGSLVTKVNGNYCCVAHAASPGYETYRTGWHSLVIQAANPPAPADAGTLRATAGRRGRG